MIIDFSRYSTIKAGAAKEVAVIDALDDFDEKQIIGGASNLLVTENAENLAVLGKVFNRIEHKEWMLKVGAATPNAKVANFCKKHNFGGMEFLSQLPGTIGGAVKMNAGLKEWEIRNILLGIMTHKGFIPASELGLEYRKSIIDTVIFEAFFRLDTGWDDTRLELFRTMRANQPKEPSAGSFFKNPPNDYAGRLIESVGLKGERIGDAAFSEKHANFLVNLGKASVEDILSLKELAQRRVYEETGVRLEEEVKIL